MDSCQEGDDSEGRKRGRPKKQDKSGKKVRHAGRLQVPPTDKSDEVRRSGRKRVPRPNKADSERRVTKQRCTRWKTFEKQILLRALQEKSAVAQFNYNSIRKLVKTKKQIDVELYLKRIRKRAMKAKIEAMRKKSPIEIWQDLMNHFGDADNHSIRDMSKVMLMASLERTFNCDSITSNDFKPRRVYRYIGALFKSKDLPTLTPLESQVILDCFENMLEVLKGSEIRDKAAFVRAQYFNLYNKAFTGGNNYSVEDNLGLVIKETQSEQPHSSSSSSQPRTNPTSGIQTDESVPGTSGEPNKSSVKKKVLWRGGVDRSNEVRLLNPLGIPVDMLEFKHRDEESNSRKRWTYEHTDYTSDSDDSYSDWDDDEGKHDGGKEKQNGQVRRKRGVKGKKDRECTDEDGSQDSGGNSSGDPNGLQDMIELLDTNQYAFMTEEEFVQKGIQSNGNLDVSDVVNSDQYVFVPKDNLAREGKDVVEGLEEMRGGEAFASPDIRGDTGESIPMDETHMTLDTKSVDHFESEHFEITGQFENDDSFEEESTTSDVDQSEVRDACIDQSDFMVNEISLLDNGDSGINPTEDTMPSTDPAISPTCTTSTSEPTDVEDVINLIPSISTSSLPEQPSCENSIEVLTAVSLSSNEATASNPINTIASQVVPDQPLVLNPSSPEKIHGTYVPIPSTPILHTSEALGGLESGAVKLLLPQKETKSDGGSLHRTADDTDPNTILLENAMNRGIVSSDVSDDQLLTIDVSQLGPDSKIVIPSYLLPGGVLTIRSPDVSRMRRSDASSLNQTGAVSSDTPSSQSQGSKANQSQDAMLADIGLERADPVFSSQSEINTNIMFDPRCQAEVGVSCTTGNILEETGLEEESISEDEISQTEYIIASDCPSKESSQLCEVHVIASHILKPNNQAEVPLKTSPKVLLSSKKSEDSIQSNEMHSEVFQAEEEEGSFLEFLSSQKSVLGSRKESTMPKGLLLNESGRGHSQLERHDIEKSAVSKSLIGISKTNLNRPLNIPHHSPPDSQKHKGECLPTKEKHASPSNIGHKPLDASDLHDKPKKKVGRPQKVRAETDAVSRVPENQDLRNSRTHEEKQNRGCPAKPKSTISEQHLEMQEGTSVSTEGKKKRGRPRRTDKTVSVLDLDDSVLDNVETKEPTIEGFVEGGSNHVPLKEQDTGTSVSLHNPLISTPLNKCLEQKNGKKGTSIVSTDLPNNQYGKVMSHPPTTSLPGIQQKGKRGRPHKKSRQDSVLNLPKNIVLDQVIEKKLGAGELGTASGSERKEKRKRGRPPKETQSGVVDELQDKPIVHQVTDSEISNGDNKDNLGTERKERRKRGRPGKESKPDSCDDIQGRVNPSKVTDKESGNETATRSERNKNKQIESPLKDFRPYYPSVSSPRHIGKQSPGIRPKSYIKMPDRETAIRSEVGRSSIKTDNSKSEKMTKLQLSSLKTDKTRRDTLETSAGIQREEKRRRGRPCKGPKTHFSEKRILKRKSTEDEMSIGHLDSDSQTEIKHKRGRNPKTATLDPNGDLQGRIVSRRTENVDGVGQFEPTSRIEGETKEKRCPTQFVLSQPAELTDDGKAIHQLPSVHSAEKRKRGRPRKELKSSVSDNSSNSPTATKSSKWFKDIGQFKINVQSESEENKGKSRHSNDDLPNRRTSNPTLEKKVISSSLRSGTDCPKKTEVESVKTDQTINVSLDTASKSEKQTKKRGRSHKDVPRDCSGTEVRFLSKEHGTSDGHFKMLGERERDQLCKELSHGASDKVHTRKTQINSAEKETSVDPSETVRDEKRKRGRPRKLDKPNADSGSEKPERRKEGTPPKKADMSSDIMTIQSPQGEVNMDHKVITSLTDGDKQKRDMTFLEASIDSRNDSHQELDIPQTINSKNSVHDSKQKVKGNGAEWSPFDILGLTSTSHETSVSKPLGLTSTSHETSVSKPLGLTSSSHEMSVSKPLKAAGSRTDEAPSQLQKQVTLDDYIISKKTQTQGAIVPGILKKRKKRSPLKVNVGKQLANKKQMSLDSTGSPKASLAPGRSARFEKPLTDVLRRSDLFGKPKKRVSFEDAIDLMGNLSDDEGLGKDLFMKDMVSHTAMKEVMNIVKHAKLGSSSILDPQPERKTSVFFSIKKS